jgi:hypothetical protein
LVATLAVPFAAVFLAAVPFALLALAVAGPRAVLAAVPFAALFLAVVPFAAAVLVVPFAGLVLTTGSRSAALALWPASECTELRAARSERAIKDGAGVWGGLDLTECASRVGRPADHDAAAG